MGDKTETLTQHLLQESTIKSSWNCTAERTQLLYKYIWLFPCHYYAATVHVWTMYKLWDGRYNASISYESWIVSCKTTRCKSRQ